MGHATQPTGRAGYRVQIVYSEPEFRRRNPHAPPEYQFVYAGVPAKTEQEAIDLVCRRFWELTAGSWVNWRRHLQSVRVIGWAERPEIDDGEWF